MSKYFQSLRRLHAQREARVLSAERFDSRVLGQDNKGRPGGPLFRVEPFEGVPLAKRRAAFSNLIDQLRAIADRSATPALVIAGVSRLEPVDTILGGLHLESSDRSISLLIGEIQHATARRVLLDHPVLSKSGRNPGPLATLSGGTVKTAVKEWLRAHQRDFDLVVIKAPPVLESADAVLVAKACAGLVLVAEPFATARAALRTAVERAKAAGCPVVGIVMNGAESVLPRWLESLLENTSFKAKKV